MTALDDFSPVPRYLQLARLLEAEIRAAAWTPMMRVPSRVQLAERYGVDKQTVGRAHAHLARHGYVVSRPGVGMIVLPPDRWPAAVSEP